MFEIAMTAFTVASVFIRTTVFVVHAIGHLVDPLPPDQGPQISSQVEVRHRHTVQQQRYGARTVVEYWWDKNCPPCEEFAKQMVLGSPLRDKLQADYDLRPVQWSRFRPVAARRGIETLPTFYIVEEGRKVEGFSTAESLLEALAGKVPDDPPPAERTSPQPPEVPTTNAPWQPLPSQGQAPPVNPEQGDSPPDQAEKPTEADTSKVDEPQGPAEKAKSWIRETVLGFVYAAIAWLVSRFEAWRSEQSFLRKRVIDRTIRRGRQKARDRAQQSAAGRAAAGVVKDALRESQGSHPSHPHPTEAFNDNLL